MATIKAICYLYQNGDERNKCILTNSELIIYNHGHKKSFQLNSLIGAVFHEKKLLLPLIAGGIIASLGVLTNFSNYFNPWITMSVAIAGIYLFYYGWTGTWTLSLSTSLGNTDIYIRRVSMNLKAFVNYLNNVLLDRKMGVKKYANFYYPISKEKWDLINKTKIGLNSEKEKLKLLTHDQMQIIKLQLPNQQLIISIDPATLSQEIKFEFDHQSGELCPYVSYEISLLSLSIDFD